MSVAPKPRPKYYDLNLAHLWPPALLSIFHRVTGAVLFFPLLPLGLYILQTSLTSEAGFARWHDLLQHPIAKAVIFLVAWSYAHHFFAGIRYLILDLHVMGSKPAARSSALAVFVLGFLAALAVGACLW